MADWHFLWLLAYGLASLGGPAQGLAYGVAITLLLQSKPWARWLRLVGLAGRMALSNYLMQSLICTTIFYSYGFGLFGSVGRVTSWGLVVLVFVTQVSLSAWWLGRFQFGPMEWLWRTLTYGQRQPMRR